MRSDRLKLIQDGKRAAALLVNGMKPRDVLLIVGGSRARLYRALAQCETKIVTNGRETSQSDTDCQLTE